MPLKSSLRKLDIQNSQIKNSYSTVHSLASECWAEEFHFTNIFPEKYQHLPSRLLGDIYFYGKPQKSKPQISKDAKMASNKTTYKATFQIYQ